MDFLNRPLKELYRWRDMVTLGVPFETWMKDVPSKFYKQYDMVRPKLKIGIEVEVENARFPASHLSIGHLWNIKEDGSLRNNGREFVSMPLSDQMIPYSVAVLFNEILPKDADFSERTSIHVHANVRTWSQGDVLNLMLLYIVFEKLLYRFAGPKRYKNIFCVPIQETKLPVALSDYLANHDFPMLVSSWAKYSGLNLLPIKSQGTVEYRHMEGHRDTERLLTWINIIQQLHKTADTLSFERIFNDIRVLNTTSAYEQFVHDVFRGGSHHFTKFNLQKEMEYGVSVVKAIREPSPFLNALLDGITNNAPLLKALNLSEAETKKVRKPVEKVDHHPEPIAYNLEANLGRLEEIRPGAYQWIAGDPAAHWFQVMPQLNQAAQIRPNPLSRDFVNAAEFRQVRGHAADGVEGDFIRDLNLRWIDGRWRSEI